MHAYIKILAGLIDADAEFCGKRGGILSGLLGM